MPPAQYSANPEDQIDSLQQCGMHIPDRESALHFVRNIGIGLLHEYLLPFEDGGGFRAGARFDEVMNLYNFDRKLRLLVMDAAGVVEVSVRAQMLFCGALDSWKEAQKMTMGNLSRHYWNIQNRDWSRRIADAYAMNDGVLASFLHHLAGVRNICAHHQRLWNHYFRIRPRLPRLPRFPMAKPQPQPFFHFNLDAPRKIYNTLVILVYLTELISPSIGWRRQLRSLLTTHGDIRQSAMGFPPDWQQSPFWREGE